LACSSSDVEVFLDVLSQDKKTKLVEKLMEGCESPSITPTKALGKSITLFKVQEFLGNFFTLAVRGMSSDFFFSVLILFCFHSPYIWAMIN